MIASLRGRVLQKEKDGVIIEVNGIGYSVHLMTSALLSLTESDQEILCYTVESVAMYGGGVTLYGFLHYEEKKIFNAIRDHVSGIGAKKAVELLDKAVKSLPDFRRAIIEKDPKSLSALFGYTPKTAEKIVTGLHGKLDSVAVSKGAARSVGAGFPFEESIQGLVSLGYKEIMAREAVREASGKLKGDVRSEDLIREALRHLSSGKSF